MKDKEHNHEYEYFWSIGANWTGENRHKGYWLTPLWICMKCGEIKSWLDAEDKIVFAQ